MGGHFSSLLAAVRDAGARIPVAVLTGFLGSGKTTLLNRLLRQPAMEGTVVVVNEFGSIGIDHDLIAHTTDDIVLLANGCMCCSVRGDLVAALHRIATQPTAAGAPVQRVLIETSGLADPGPILRSLIGDAALRARFRLAGVACTVDAVLGLHTLRTHPEARHQAAVADMLLLTKMDMAASPQPPAALLEALQALGGAAALHTDSALHAQRLRALLERPCEQDAPHESPTLYYRPHGGDAPAPHGDGIRSFTIVRDQPVPRDAFLAWMDMLIAMRGDDLLRVKGLVQLAEEPTRPLVLQGVQHLFQPPEFLPAWPGEDRRTRIVFITRGVDAQALDDTLRVFERRRARSARSPATRPAPPTASPPETLP